MIDSKLVQSFSETFAPSGQCRMVIDRIKKYLNKNFKDNPFISHHEDRMRNFIVKRQGTNPSLPSVTINVAMDEAFLFITHIDDKAGIHFESIGFAPSTLIGKQVLVTDQLHNGVIGYPAIHLQRRFALDKKPIRTENLVIDMGFQKKEDAEAEILAGDIAFFNPVFGETESFYRGKALDTRLPLVVALALLSEERIQNEITLFFTSVSKSYPWGASTAAFENEGDYRIVLQSGDAYDFPLPPQSVTTPFSKQSNTHLGGGALLNVMDRSYISDVELFKAFVTTADKEKILYQINEKANEENEAGMWQLTGEGERVFSLGLPIRYRNSPYQVAAKEDMRSLYQLLVATISQLPNK